MKKHYDFPKGERGKFFIGNDPYDVVIHVDQPESGAKFEVFSSPDGKYRFRLAEESRVLFTSEEGFDSQDACLSAISVIKRNLCSLRLSSLDSHTGTYRGALLRGIVRSHCIQSCIPLSRGSSSPVASKNLSNKKSSSS